MLYRHKIVSAQGMLHVWEQYAATPEDARRKAEVMAQPFRVFGQPLTIISMAVAPISVTTNQNTQPDNI